MLICLGIMVYIKVFNTIYLNKAYGAKKSFSVGALSHNKHTDIKKISQIIEISKERQFFFL